MAQGGAEDHEEEAPGHEGADGINSCPSLLSPGSTLWDREVVLGLGFRV